MLVNSSLMANVQANIVPMAVIVALGSLIFTIILLLGLAILCHPLWIVKWTQKLQPHVMYLKPTQEKLVALTLDDGPHAHITPQLLDILKENNCRATWFLIGNHMARCPLVVDRIIAEGHEVANHMMADVASWTLSKEEFETQLIECDNRLKDYYRNNSSGQAQKWFRPGHGFYNMQIVKTCKKHGYRVALGSLYPMDHMFERQAHLLVKILLWRIHPGAVIILHDRVPQWAQTPLVLRLLLPELRKRGYRVVSLSELEESVSNPEVKQAD